MGQLVVNADDFGISDGATEAIVDAHLNGIVSSTSVMANMPGFELAVKMHEVVPNLGFGAHLSLNVGRPILATDTIPLLCDDQGWLQSSFMKHSLRSSKAEYQLQAYRELKAQLEKLLSHGFHLDHLNGQSHLQMIPMIYQIFSRLQKEYQIPYLRFTGEPLLGHPSHRLSGVLKNSVLRTYRNFCIRADGEKTPRIQCVGVTQTGRMDVPALLHYISRLGNSATELMTHPGTGFVPSGQNYQDWVRDYLTLDMRQIELRSLKDESVKSFMTLRGIRPTTFRELAAH